MTPKDFRAAGRQAEELEDAASIDRLPPHSQEGEQGVLACIFLSPQECIPICIEKFKDRSDVFYELRHRNLYELLVEFYDAQKPVEIIGIQQALRDRQQLDSVGGVGYLASLPDAVPSAANLGYYIDIVLEKHALRLTIGACSETIGRAYEFSGELPEFLERFGSDVNKIIQGATSAGKNGLVRSAKELAPIARDTIEQIYLGNGTAAGISTGFHDFDKMTRGLHKGEMTIIAARPSVGKSSLAMNVADYVGIEKKLPVAVFSLEMSAESLMLRMICSQARVDIAKATGGTLSSPDFPKITAAVDKLVKAPIYIDDSRGLSILQLKARARQLKQQRGIELFIVDYLQLLHSTNSRAQNREQEVANVSSGLHDLAGELNVPVLVLAQLNRESEKRGPNSKPRLSDLRESGALEQDADLVGLLYRPGQQDEDYWEHQKEAVAVNLVIAKQRNGPTGEIPLVFLRPYTRFESATKPKSNDPAENFPKGK